MAFENKLAAVSPQAFTANGTSLGVATIGSTCGFYIKQFVILKSDSLPQIQLQIKNILSTTQLIVGPNNNSLTASPKNITDISGYTVVDGATISAPEQNNFPIPADDHYNTVYMPAPVSSDRVIGIDCYGNPWDTNNPIPINIFPATQIPFTLGSLALPALISKYINTLTYNEVTSDSIGTEEVLTFYEGSTNVGEINLSQTQDGWVLNLGVAEEDFLLLETGAFFVLENDSGGILLE